MDKLDFETFWSHELFNKGHENLDKEQARIVFDALNSDWEESHNNLESDYDEIIKEKDEEISDMCDEIFDLKKDLKDLKQQLEFDDSEFDVLENQS